MADKYMHPVSPETQALIDAWQTILGSGPPWRPGRAHGRAGAGKISAPAPASSSADVELGADPPERGSSGIPG